MAARQTKSNMSEGSCSSRIMFRARNSVILRYFLELILLHPRRDFRRFGIVPENIYGKRSISHF